MKYKSFILLLTVVLVLSLTACGKSPAPGKSELFKPKANESR